MKIVIVNSTEAALLDILLILLDTLKQIIYNWTHVCRYCIYYQRSNYENSRTFKAFFKQQYFNEEKKEIFLSTVSQQLYLHLCGKDYICFSIDSLCIKNDRLGAQFRGITCSALPVTFQDITVKAFVFNIFLASS